MLHSYLFKAIPSEVFKAKYVQNSNLVIVGTEKEMNFKVNCVFLNYISWPYSPL